MEWTNREGNTPATPNQAAAPSGPKHHGTKSALHSKIYQIGTTALLFSVTILVVFLILFVYRLDNRGDNKDIITKQMQAVFLNGGQVYFGKIDSITESSMRLSEIYYLRVNQQVQPNQAATQAAQNDISLVKLGCELHGPQDRMVINRDQIIFWENLKDDGQVAKAVAEYKKANPNGQKCDTAAATPTTNTPAPTTPAPTTPTNRRP